MRRLSVSMAAVGVLFLCLNFTTAQAASGRGMTSTGPSTTHLAAKTKHWKGYHCPPGQAKKFRC